jgi:type I restriction enzyme S subunit
LIDTRAIRNIVLDLAIRGKLTEQLAEDGDAVDLYAKMQEEKSRLVKEGKIKKKKSLPVISKSEQPFSFHGTGNGHT